MGEEEKQEFAERLVAWQIRFGRHGLPWMTEDPYRRWLSEVMLQQTQVSVVVEYFERFLGWAGLLLAGKKPACLCETGGG